MKKVFIVFLMFYAMISILALKYYVVEDAAIHAQALDVIA